MDEAKSGLDSLLDVYRNIVFFDVETTGFNAQANRIIELAAIGVRRNFQGKAEIWREMDVYCKLPEGQKIPEEIIKLTGITDQMLIEHGVSDDEMAKQFAEIMTGEDSAGCPENFNDTLLVAHNAQFDLNFIGFLYVLQMKHDSEGPQYREWLHRFNAADYLDTLNIQAGHCLMAACDRVTAAVVCGNISKGMKSDIDFASLELGMFVETKYYSADEAIALIEKFKESRA